MLHPYRPGDAGHLVGERASGLVVIGARLNRQRPGFESVDLLTGAPRNGGRTQDRAGPVGEQHSDVAVPTLGDTSQIAVIARGEFPRGEPEEARIAIPFSASWIAARWV
jgi:hypothetical protein